MRKHKKQEIAKDSTPAPTARQQLFGNWTGKLPLNLIHEHCTREKWEKPIFRTQKKVKGFQCFVKIRKLNKKSSQFEEIEFSSLEYFETEQLAKHSTATYALHRICSQKNIHTLLPPSQRDLWLKYDKEKQESDPELVAINYASDPFEAIRIANERESEQKSAKAIEPWRNYPALHISKELRERLEFLLRSNINHVINNEKDSVGEKKMDSKVISTILIKKGFRPAHVEEALQYCTDLKSSMDWLCIHCPEDDLPPSFRPSENKSMVFSNLNTEKLSNSLLIQRLMRSGFSRSQCILHLEQSGGNEYFALASLCLELGGINHQPVDMSEPIDMMEILAEEKEVLQSIYPENFQFEDTMLGICFSFELEKIGKVEILVSKDSQYPYTFPGIAIEGKELPTYIKLATIRKLIKESAAIIGTPMIYSIVSMIEENAMNFCASPPSLLSLYQKSDALEFGTTELKKAKSKPIHRARHRSKILEEYQKMIASDDYLKMLQVRKKLPSYSYKSQICKYLEENQVLVICGETGCGKSTQLGQFIMEYLFDNFIEDFNILCTQPRRISAISLAERVAAERADKLGNLVGYSIRGESKQSNNTRLLFCTNGILLRMIQTDKDLENVTHVIIDEVHERGVDSDFLLVLLRDLLTRRPDLRIILMSATIESSILCEYFSCSAIEIPGFTHPVEDIYLERILEMTGYKLENINTKLQKNSELETDKFDESQGNGDNIFLSKLVRFERDLNFKVDYGLISSTVNFICANYEEGAILIFLPGILEIKRCVERIKEEMKNSLDSLRIFPLHSALTSKEQSSVFQKMSKGIRKIVVSTNIAETSVTIDDVVFVIDTGRVKEMGLKDRILSLNEVWASKAACKQRRGRAGRVKPGFAFKLFTSQFSKNYMRGYIVPEILRLPLEQLCLQIKFMGIDDVAEFLGKALSPPPLKNITQALELLEELNALDDHQKITPLGKHISQLPTDIRIAKMLIFAAIFKCIDPILTIASYMGGKSPLISPADKRQDAETAHQKFIRHQSDHLTVCEAYNQWLKVGKNSKSAQWNFCDSNFLSMSTLSSMSDLRKQFADMLIELGYLSKDTWSNSNTNSKNDRVIKSIILSGLDVAGIQFPQQQFVNTGEGAISIDVESKNIKFFAGGDRVFIHPSSNLFSETKYEEGSVVAFGSKVSTSKIFLRDCSAVPAIALLLFGGKVKVIYGGKALCLNSIRYQAFPRTSALISGMRRLLDLSLIEKIKNPSVDVLDSDLGSLCIDLIRSQ